MKKITLLIILMISSLGNSQTLEGTWKISPQAGALGVGPGQGNIGWWSNSVGDVTGRACLFDDEYVFNSDGSFSNVVGAETFLEGWQTGVGDACGAPLTPHDGSNAASYAHDASANTIVLTGVGAYLGLPKAYNGGELANPAAAPESVTYTVVSLTSNLLTLDIKVGGEGWWRFILAKQGVDPSCSDGIKNGDETGIDCGGTCSPCAASKTQMNLPVSFEGSTIDYALSSFGGTTSTIEVDPTLSSNTVVKVIKAAASETWAGTTVTAKIGSLETGFSSAIPFVSGTRKMNVKVWSPTAGTPVRLKVEDHNDGTHSVETEVLTTVANGWQTLEFNFDVATLPATAGFNEAFTYDKASIFFDFGTPGTGATYYFDEVAFGEASTPVDNTPSLEGTWKISPQAGALGVGPGQGNIGWWSNSSEDVTARACLFDDEYVFNSDGSFSNVIGAETFLEGWQSGAGDACGTPIAPHDGSNAASYVHDATANTIVLTGVGAYLGLPKVYNGGELVNPAAAPESVTYTVVSHTANLLTLDVKVGGEGWWRFILAKQAALSTASFNAKNIKIYPNPASNNLSIQGNSSIDRVSLYTILGQEVLSKSPKTKQVSLDISNLQNGMYIVKTTSEGVISTSRVLKQ